MSVRVTTALLAFFLCAASWAADENGLVAHWGFDEGAGAILRDKSGNRNHCTIHGAKWIRIGGGFALQFDGVDDFVECPGSPWLNPREQLTLEAWIRPDRPTERPREAAIVGKGKACFGCYGLTYFLDRCYMYIGGTQGNCWTAVLPMKVWSHVVGTYDGKLLRMYVDGEIHSTTEPPALGMPDSIKSVFIGCTIYKKMNYFPGTIAEVRVYDRALPEATIFQRYLAKAESLGRDVSGFKRIGMKPHVYRVPGKIVVDVDFRGMRPIAGGGSLQVGVFRPGDQEAIAKRSVAPVPPSGSAEVSFDVAVLPPGDYEIHARLAGRPKGEPAVKPVRWPGRPEWFRSAPPVKVLNNLVLELLNVEFPPVKRDAAFSFVNPYDRWVFFSSTAVVGDGELGISLDRNEQLISHAPGASTREAMRFLPAGRHRLRVRSKDGVLKQLVVRSIPEMPFCKLYPEPYLPQIAAFGPYDWDFLKHAGILDNANVMISRKDTRLDKPRHAAYVKDWTSQGKRWIIETGLTRQLSPEVVAKSWLSEPGMKHPGLSGVLLDEFGGSPAENYRAWTGGMRLVGRSASAKGRTIYPYCGDISDYAPAQDFVKAVMDSGNRIAWETYIGEEAARTAAVDALNRSLRRPMIRWRDNFPRVERHMVVTLAYFSAPPESCDRHTNADYKVFMDMQFNMIANDPAFSELFGIMEYTSAFADEEIVRWMARLMRHYCIEGRREPLTADPYELSHIANGDFAEGGKGWTLSPAEDGGINFGAMSGYGWMQGRYPTTKAGSTFLYTKRSAKGPNRFSQNIVRLVPGRLYSLRFITGDRRDMSVERKHAVRVEIQGAKLIPDKTFQQVYGHCSTHSACGYGGERRAWMNFHRVVFRALSERSTLVISDWASQGNPGAPAGQETMFNFIQIQPYLRDGK